MYVRVKKNPSGTSTVMLVKSERRAGKRNSYSVLIKNFGTTKDPKALNKLKKQAELLRADMGESNKKANILKISTENDFKSCTSINLGFNDIYGKIYNNLFKKKIKLTPSKQQLLKELSILRIAQPCSKLKSASIGKEYGYEFKVDSAYKLMDKIDKDIIMAIKESIADHSSKLIKANKGSIDVVFYDLTTVYFEANEKDELRQFGFSKDGKSQHVQITLALLVTKEGLPIGYELFPGNMYEGHTVEALLDKLERSYKLSNVVIVADSGLLNRNNISMIRNKGYGYIIAARLKSMRKEMMQKVIDMSEYSSINENLSAKIITQDDGQKLICCYSKKKAAKDCYEREQRINKLINKQGCSVKSLLPAKHNKPYIKINNNSTINIDEDSAKNEAVYDGFYVLATNMDVDNPLEVITQYKGLWQVERSFRIMKTDLSIRPVFHWSVARVMAHFAICYISFALVRYLQFSLNVKGLKISASLIRDTLDSVRATNILDKNGASFRVMHDLNENAKNIYKLTRTKSPDKLFSI